MKTGIQNNKLISFKALGYFLYVSVVTVIMLEILLRLLLYEPYHFYPFSIHSEPQACVFPDSIYGFRLNSGTYTVTINKGLHFKTTHNKQGQRMTNRPSQSEYTIQLHGCSYTYGFGIADSLTVAYQLQERLKPTISVENHAVLGYGNVQSYHAIQAAIQAGNQPDLVIINYASFHDDRNVLTPMYRKDLKNGFANADSSMHVRYQQLRFPYVKWQNNQLTFCWDRWDHIYQNWIGREHSALINLLQTIADKWSISRFKKEEWTNLLFKEIHQLCTQHHIKLLVTGITQNHRTEELLFYCQQQGIPTLNISVDLLDVQFNNLPFDTHPNGNAHTHFATALAQYIQKTTVVQK
ncbi:MAG: hypothetical protein ACPGJS_23080 [Flammeovirgaceae bacterium]